MMAANYPTQPGMGPGHPAAMAHGHPMNMHHPAGHMGQPNAAMMHAMSGPQGTPATMASGMPPNPGTPATGGPMQNPMAMAHLGGPQGPMFPGGNQQMHVGGMSQLQHNNLLAARQRALVMAQQNGGQMPPGMMKTMGNMQHFNQQQLQQMGMAVPMNQMQQLTPQQQQQVLQQQQNYTQQQRYMAHQAMQHQAMIAAQQRQTAQQQQALQNQQQTAQQMQMTRSQEPATQPPQPQSTPAPQAPPQPQATPTSQTKPQPQPPTSQPQQNSAPQPTNPATPQVKQPDAEDEASVKSELSKQQIIPDVSDIKVTPASFAGQSILQLLSYQDALANPENPHDYDYWQLVISRYFSSFGSIRQQVFNQQSNNDKAFQLQFASLARFYYSHFKNGIKQILMQANNYNMHTMDGGGYMIHSGRSTITYVYDNDVRITTWGSIKVNFDENQRIECLFLETKGWSEHVPRALLQEPASPEQTRSPRSKKNQKGQQNQQSQPGFKVPRSPCGAFGLPDKLLQFLEIAEIITTMGPIMLYSQDHQTGPREALMRINAERMGIAQVANHNLAMANGQVAFPNQKMGGMNPPNPFQSPAFSHLGLPQGQNSPHMGGPNHTPSPAHNAVQGGVPMMNQMSAQGSNLSGSQGPSTNTSPNVTNKRRRPSAIKDEDGPGQGDSKTKPSPRVGGKRQKGAAS